MCPTLSHRRIAGIAASAFAILLLFPHAAAFAQCATKPNPKPTISIGAPGHRGCCALGTQSGLDPKNLKPHQYGHGDTVLAQTRGQIVPGGEPNGYIYTPAAGLVDIGHVRDNADALFYVYIQLLNGQHTFQVVDDAVGVPDIPTTKAQMLGLAGTIVWANSWRHELTTWGQTTYTNFLVIQDYSAFSPEDLSSNIVGIKIATEAINNGNITTAEDFNTQMDLVLPAMMTFLGALTQKDTNAALASVQYDPSKGVKDLTGMWFMRDLTVANVPNNSTRLLRRNFDGAAWKMPLTPQAATPTSWLNTSQFSDYYPQFLYLVSDKAIVDATQVPDTNDYALNPGSAFRWMQSTGMTGAANAAQPGAGPATPPCLTDPKTHLPIPSGLYTIVKVNDSGVAEPQYYMWKFEDVMTFIRSEFTRVNPNMDDPQKYLPPAPPVKK